MLIWLSTILIKVSILFPYLKIRFAISPLLKLNFSYCLKPTLPFIADGRILYSPFAPGVTQPADPPPISVAIAGTTIDCCIKKNVVNNDAIILFCRLTSYFIFCCPFNLLNVNFAVHTLLIIPRACLKIPYYYVSLRLFQHIMSHSYTSYIL